jgi:preprotein translocase subunit Sec63
MGSPHIFGQKPKKHGLTKKPVIKGDFSTSYKLNYRELGVYKFNKFLAYCILALILSSMVSYMAVVNRECVVKDIHTKTNQMFYENIDLQNKVDNLKSFYAIDNKVSKINFLKKADKVIEVRAVNKNEKKKNGFLDKHNLKQVPAGF